MKEELKYIENAIYNKKVADNVNLVGAEVTFRDFSTLMIDRLNAESANFKASIFDEASFNDCSFENTNFQICKRRCNMGSKNIWN
ncbi:hypothetical protein [Clostridium sp. ZS1]|uniref:hypothetical protein n=1 Tax=Clostridium sp. ZS1 TaxID=2949989 RepID=UPI002079C899|nr:hypothetical protein [Clostridium sp. ZS1]